MEGSFDTTSPTQHPVWLDYPS